MTRSLIQAVEAAIPFAEDLFRRLRERTRDTVGVTRAAYGEGEQIAHELIAEAAGGLDLEIQTDCAGNLYMTWPGETREGHGVIAASHLDSVPRGGNYDGAAGVIAGLVALDALRREGFAPKRDLSVMAIRAEETGWFSVHHIGSRAALGALPPDELDAARRADTGRSLAEHMADLGLDVAALREGRRHLDPSRVTAYYELHIEQGPVLEHEGLPVGIVTGIRGNVRAREGRCIGRYDHAGGTPRKLRRDAVMAVAEYIGALESCWDRIEAEGGDLVLTCGRLFTNPDAHTHTKVPGEVNFSLDARSHSEETLDRMEELIRRHAAEIGGRRSVRIDLGPVTRGAVATMDPRLRSILSDGCRALGIDAMEIPSGGGHDAGDFAGAGVPSAMIFLRNPNGSHNPDEDMKMEDFALGASLLAWALTSTR